MYSSVFQEKKFLLIMPNDFGLYNVFMYNLKKLGFELIPLEPYKFKYKKKDKVVNFVQKTFLNNKSYKNKLIKKYYSEHIEKQINHIKEKSIDYVLIIRPDILNEKVLNRLLKIGKKVVPYQWDGLERFPSVFDYINHFEVFYIFDLEDFNKYKYKFSNIRLSNNFYFDFDIDEQSEIKNNNCVFYRGSYIKDRVNDIIYIVREIEKYDISMDIKLVYSRKTLPFIDKNIQFSRKNINFFDYLKQAKQAKILLDFKVKEHNGLSLRLFESIKYEKKIITNNTSVINYDFYNPNNIFILHKDSLTNLEKFLFSDYEKLPQEIVEKYAFSSWLYHCFSD